jgi:type IV pilus assembly protein PilB
MSEIDYIPLTSELQQVITTEQAWHYTIVPKTAVNGSLEFYIDEQQFHRNLGDELEILFGKEITLDQQPGAIIQKTLSKYYRKNKGHGKAVNVSSGKANDFVGNLIAEAKQLGSSDIHIEIYDEKARVRMRIDGMLVERYTLSKTDYPALVNKIKIGANLDIAEKRLPQDGRIHYAENNMKFDIRVSVLPTMHGEKIVMRLLSRDDTDVDIDAIGFSKNELSNYMEGIRKPNGILLISGPTGSGKTTTLYATLKVLNEEKRNIVTVEDPIEYTLDGINQVQLKENIGLTFASALRSFLRQDPDIIMLGEIRDGETAQMAIRAALTGHLVLSTIHTNSAWGTVSRLIDMGVPPFLLANTLNTTVAQRLIRKLCPHCKREEAFQQELLPQSFKPPRVNKKHFTPMGCDECYHTGYKGRQAIFEIIPIDYQLSVCIREGKFEVQNELKERQIHSLSANAFALFEQGVTSLDEVYPLLINL